MTIPSISPIEAASVTIANGESLSGAINCVGRIPVALLLPASWTAASITFSVSLDGATYVDAYDSDGTEIAADVAASRLVALDASKLYGVRYVKLRSGTAGTPVNQGGARDIVIMLGALI